MDRLRLHHTKALKSATLGLRGVDGNHPIELV